MIPIQNKHITSKHTAVGYKVDLYLTVDKDNVEFKFVKTHPNPEYPKLQDTVIKINVLKFLKSGFLDVHAELLSNSKCKYEHLLLKNYSRCADNIRYMLYDKIYYHDGISSIYMEGISPLVKLHVLVWT